MHEDSAWNVRWNLGMYWDGGYQYMAQRWGGVHQGLSLRPVQLQCSQSLWAYGGSVHRGGYIRGLHE